MTLNLITCLLFASSLYTFRSAAHAFRQYNYPVAHWCGWLLFAVAIYSFSYGMELSSHSLSDIIFWITIEFVSIGYIPGALILMTVSYRRHHSPSWSLVSVVLLLSSVTPLLALTNAYHYWLFEVSRFDDVNGLSIADIHLGPAYAFNMLYCNTAAIISLVLFSKVFIQSKIYRKQIGFIVAGNCIPWLLYLWNIFNFATLKIDLFPFGLVLTAFFYWHGIFHLRFANITPIAREQTFELFSEPILVVNHRYELVDYNTRAAVVFPDLSKQSIGRNLVQNGFLSQKLFVTDMSYINQMNDEYQVDDVTYEVHLYPLREKNNQILGYTVIFYPQRVQSQVKGLGDFSDYYDHLTSLMNRAGIYQHLCSQLMLRTNGLPVSIILFDIDFFKRFNQKHGFPIGDELLKNIGFHFSKTYSRQYVMGRFDGDEFMVVLSETSSLVAKQVAREFAALIESRYQVRLSYGVAMAELNDSAELLINRADLALYQHQSEQSVAQEKAESSISHSA